MNEIVMPKLSDTMTEGRLVSWEKRVGDTVERGDVLAEVETDKANMELEAFTSGVLLEIRVQPGELVQVGTVIAVIGSEQESGTASGQAQEKQVQAPVQPESAGTVAEGQGAAPGQPAAPAQGPAATPAPGLAAEAASVGASEPAKVQQATEVQAPTEVQVPTGNQVPAAVEAPAELQAKTEEQGRADAQAKAEAETKAASPATGGQQPGQPPTDEPVSAAAVERAAPVVRRRARELGIELSQVAGSGPEGRILLQDLEQHQGIAGSASASPEELAGSTGIAGTAAPVGAQAAAVSGAQAAGIAPMSRLRGAVARTVAESWRTIPHFNVTIDVLMDEAEAVRRQLKAGGIAVTLNDLIVKGMALALAKFQRLNASFAAEGIESHDQINIGVAVGVPEGVLIPVIHGCQGLSLQEIAGSSRNLVEQARKGALTEQQMGGGTISVSNLGMYGVSEFNAIIYPRQAAVLAVGAVTDAVVARAGVPNCVRLMKLTLCCDHRVIDGAYAAEFLAELKGILENPVRLLI